MSRIKDMNKCPIVTIHSLYFDGYFPQNVLPNFKELSQNIHDTSAHKAIVEQSNRSLSELLRRETAVDIPIDVPVVATILSRYQKERLFLRHNHPSNALLNAYAYAIYVHVCGLLQLHPIAPFDDGVDTRTQLLNTCDTYEPIEDITRCALNLQFS
jgi:hypothetical protein